MCIDHTYNQYECTIMSLPLQSLFEWVCLLCNNNRSLHWSYFPLLWAWTQCLLCDMRSGMLMSGTVQIQLSNQNLWLWFCETKPSGGPLHTGTWQIRVLQSAPVQHPCVCVSKLIEIEWQKNATWTRPCWRFQAHRWVRPQRLYKSKRPGYITELCTVKLLEVCNSNQSQLFCLWSEPVEAVLDFSRSAASPILCYCLQNLIEYLTTLQCFIDVSSRSHLHGKVDIKLLSAFGRDRIHLLSERTDIKQPHRTSILSLQSSRLFPTGSEARLFCKKEADHGGTFCWSDWSFGNITWMPQPDSFTLE